MAVIVELQNTGDTESQRDVRAMIEHVLSDRRGDWRVSIIGANDRWEMTILGPHSFERCSTLEGSAGQHEPAAIGAIVSKIVSAKRWFP